MEPQRPAAFLRYGMLLGASRKARDLVVAEWQFGAKMQCLRECARHRRRSIRETFASGPPLSLRSLPWISDRQERVDAAPALVTTAHLHSPTINGHQYILLLSRATQLAEVVKVCPIPLLSPTIAISRLRPFTSDLVVLETKTRRRAGLSGDANNLRTNTTINRICLISKGETYYATTHHGDR
jgi:hypothetical protein